MDPKFTSALDGIISVMTTANIGIPLIFGAASSLIGIWHAAHPDDPVLTAGELATRIEAQCQANAAYGAAEIARLRALIGG